MHAKVHGWGNNGVGTGPAAGLERFSTVSERPDGRRAVRSRCSMAPARRCGPVKQFLNHSRNGAEVLQPAAPVAVVGGHCAGRT